MSKPKVVLYPAGKSGCAWWRIRNPMEAMKHVYDDIECVVLDTTKMTREMVYEAIQIADLAVLQAPGSMEGLSIIRGHITEIVRKNKIDKKRVKVAVDYDDYSFDLSPYNPRYKDLGTEEAKDDNGNWLWRDGYGGFDMKSNRNRYNAFVSCISECDVVTTTTHYLRDKFLKFNPNVCILPNSIDFNKWGEIKRPERMKNEIRVGWFGGDSHYKDLLQIKPMFKPFIEKY